MGQYRSTSSGATSIDGRRRSRDCRGGSESVIPQPRSLPRPAGSAVRHKVHLAVERIRQGDLDRARRDKLPREPQGFLALGSQLMTGLRLAQLDPSEHVEMQQRNRGGGTNQPFGPQDRWRQIRRVSGGHDPWGGHGAFVRRASVSPSLRHLARSGSNRQMPYLPGLLYIWKSGSAASRRWSAEDISA